MAPVAGGIHDNDTRFPVTVARRFDGALGGAGGVVTTALGTPSAAAKGIVAATTWVAVLMTTTLSLVAT